MQECELFAVPGRSRFQDLVNEHFKAGPPDIIIHAGFNVDFRIPAADYREQNTDNVVNTAWLVEKARLAKSSALCIPERRRGAWCFVHSAYAK